MILMKLEKYDSYEVGEILVVLLKRNVISEVQNSDETVLQFYVKFLSRQLDNDNVNNDENDNDIFSRTDKHRTYEIPQTK